MSTYRALISYVVNDSTQDVTVGAIEMAAQREGESLTVRLPGEDGAILAGTERRLAGRTGIAVLSFAHADYMILSKE